MNWKLVYNEYHLEKFPSFPHTISYFTPLFEMDAILERSEDIVVYQECDKLEWLTTRGKCIWSKEEDSGVYQDEVIGYLITEEGTRTLLRAPIAGKLAKIHFSVSITIFSYVGW